MSTVNKNKLLTVEAVQELKTYIDKQDNQNITRAETVVTTGAVPLINRGVVSTSRANKWAELETSDVFHEFNATAVPFNAGSSLTMTTTSEGCHIDTIYIKTASGTQVTISNGTELVYNKNKNIPLGAGENVLTFAPMDWSKYKNFHITFITDAQIFSIKAYGDGEAGEYLAHNDHLYKWDENGNATFAADVKSGTGISLNQTKASLDAVENRVGDLESYKNNVLNTQLSEIESSISTLDDTVAVMNGEKEDDETNPQSGILTLAKEYTDGKIEEVGTSITSQASVTTALDGRVSDIETYLSSGETNELKDLHNNNSLYARVLNVAKEQAKAEDKVLGIKVNGQTQVPDSNTKIIDLDLSSSHIKAGPCGKSGGQYLVWSSANEGFTGSIFGITNTLFKTFEMFGSIHITSSIEDGTSTIFTVADIKSWISDTVTDITTWNGQWWANLTSDGEDSTVYGHAPVIVKSGDNFQFGRLFTDTDNGNKLKESGFNLGVLTSLTNNIISLRFWCQYT